MKNFQARRSLKNVALLAVLGCAVIGLSQCRMVQDNVTGVDLNALKTVSARSECVKDCQDVAKAADRAEDARFDAAKRACGRDKDCEKAAKEVHKDRQDAIKDAMQECKRGCYNEGSGHGGR